MQSLTAHAQRLLHTTSCTALAAACAIALAACGSGGGGGGGGAGDSGAGTTTTPPAPAIQDAQRIAAATTTASTNADCAESVLGSFYWEVGDATGVKASGTVGTSPPTATTVMSIASASKWLYSSYVLQKLNLNQMDVPFLNFTSGYSLFKSPVCKGSDTVGSCLADGNDGQDPASIGKFLYASGHMQHHAVYAMGLGAMDNAALTSELAVTLGNFGLQYIQPQLAGGLAGSAAQYRLFLQRLLRGELRMAAALGSNKVCTNITTCSTALKSPVPDTENWNYSLGHWVEDDPVVGDHAFSSPGAFGFYPWIDANKTIYGVLARRANSEANAGYNSARCGRLIRKAWLTGNTI